MVVAWVFHPCELVFLVFHPCIVTKNMDLLHTMTNLMVPPSIVIEGTFVLESWGLRTDRENFIVEEFLPNWVEPTKGLETPRNGYLGYRSMVVGME